MNTLEDQGAYEQILVVKSSDKIEEYVITARIRKPKNDKYPTEYTVDKKGFEGDDFRKPLKEIFLEILSKDFSKSIIEISIPARSALDENIITQKEIDEIVKEHNDKIA